MHIKADLNKISREAINVLTPCLSEQKTALLSHTNNLLHISVKMTNKEIIV